MKFIALFVVTVHVASALSVSRAKSFVGTSDWLTMSQLEATTVRTAMFDAFVQVNRVLQEQTKALYGTEAYHFPRNGFLLSTSREKGLFKWDMDIDMAILDINCQKFSAVLQGAVRALEGVYISRPLTCNCGFDPFPCGGWQLSKNGLSWPVMDGVTWRTDDRNVYFHDAGFFHDPNIREHGGGLPLDAFSQLSPLKFYCVDVLSPMGYSDYLRARYGDDVQNVAINKCNVPNGPLYIHDSAHCHYACYAGAGGVPLALVAGIHSRGAITSGICPGFDQEESYTADDWQVSNETLQKTRDMIWAKGR